MSDTIKNELERDVKILRDDVSRIAQSIRVQLHLAGMDAKEAFKEVEPKLEEFERRAESKAQDVGKELKALGSDVRARLQKIGAMLDPKGK